MFLVAFWPTAIVLATDYELRGSVRSRLGVFSPIQGDDWNLELRARPEFYLYLKDWLTATVTVRAQRNWGASEDTLGEADLQLDRAYFDIQAGKWDLRVGRQAVNFGQALIWNPVDLVDSNTALDFDVVKEGIDAFRASYSLSSTAGVMALVAFPDGGPLTLVRVEALVGNADLSVLLARDARDDDTIFGVDVKGDLGVGYWAEGAYHDRDAGEDFFQLVVGFDYSLPVRDQLYLAAQYYRDSSGASGLGDYDFTSLGTGRRFLARQYASFISSLTLSELTSVSASVIYNLEDQSFATTVGLTRFFFENLEVNVRGSFFDGSGPGEFNPVTGSPLQGRQPTEVYELYLEWSF